VEIINRIPKMISIGRELRAEGHRVGLVPTMGALHEGHLSLVDRAVSICDRVVVSVFVNPLQFGPAEDYERYPRDLARDAELAFTRGVDIIFAPAAEEMFPADFGTYVKIDRLADQLEGASRPGHFVGVATVVAKLFNIVHPNFAFFGRKDAQQSILIKRMVRDLSMDVEVVVCPVVRESDGLAISSRNQYLGADERMAAVVLRRALERCRTLYNAGERDSARLINAMKSILGAEPLARVDYVAITDTLNLRAFDFISSDTPALVSIAVRIGDTRLIDNIVLNGEL
jgi:pantoate--beta-alanine ligase